MVVAKVSALVPRAVGDTTTTVTARELPVAGVTTVQPASATTFAGSTTYSMHVGALNDSSKIVRSKWEAVVIITVHDHGENALDGVLVTGTWSEGGEATCVTGADGTCFVIKNNLKTTVPSVDFGITNLALNGYTYEPTDNHVTSITVSAP